jgi:N-acetylneuraminic acid mutarotase
MNDLLSRRMLLTTVPVAAGSAALVWRRYTEGGGRPPSPWTSVPPIPLARSEFAAAVIDGKIYAVGGFDGGNRVDALDPTTGVWTQTLSLPELVHHSGVAALGNRLFVVGGYSEEDMTAFHTVWSWSPGETIWTIHAPLPKARGALGLAVVDDAIYAVGGAFETLGGPVCGETLRFDAIADRWDELAPMVTPREHLAVVTVDTRVHAIGGRANGDERDQFAAANEQFDTATGQWTTAAPLPVPRGGLSGTRAGSRIVVLGGERRHSLFASANRYDPSANTWETLPSMPTARHGIASAWVEDGLYAIAGSTLAGQVQNTAVVERLELSA